MEKGAACGWIAGVPAPLADFSVRSFVGGRQYARAMTFFALTMVHGPGWDPSRGIREQRAWDEHAAFMDGLVDDGFIVLGGPIGDGEQALLVAETTDEREIQARLGEDPWVLMGLLHIGAIQPWTIWLDGRQRIRTH